MEVAIIELDSPINTEATKVGRAVKALQELLCMFPKKSIKGEYRYTTGYP
jgi:hypothetical protein